MSSQNPSFIHWPDQIWIMDCTLNHFDLFLMKCLTFTFGFFNRSVSPYGKIIIIFWNETVLRALILSWKLHSFTVFSLCESVYSLTLIQPDKSRFTHTYMSLDFLQAVLTGVPSWIRVNMYQFRKTLLCIFKYLTYSSLWFHLGMMKLVLKMTIPKLQQWQLLICLK